MMEAKKTWVEPELIVIVRGHPEEAILTACKASKLATNYDSLNNG